RPWVYTVPLLTGGAWYAGHHPEPHIPAQPHQTHVQAPHVKPNPAHPANFNAFKDFTLESEGGYTHRKKSVDPGGATNFGITQKTYNEWQDMANGSPLKTHKSVKHLELDTAKVILRDLYWAKVHAKQLPEAVAVAVADMGVLQGPGKA
ncbi:glycosyl hydrolase 108 family protein, partial [Enterococcus faecium]|uniref:glycosyl hydrolase 108 family protein n=2 Tax=Bacteria TaxID=2 RepID=UPI003AAF7893